MKQIANFHIEGRPKHSLQVVGADESNSLPSLATATDVREAVQFLKRYEDGITVIQAMDALRKRIFDARKVVAYEFWGLISRTGDRLRLTPLGWELAKRLTPEAAVYRAILGHCALYHAALQWINDRGVDLVTYSDIAELWRQLEPELLGSDTEEESEARVASFFQLCHAAEVGMLTIGRKRQPTRFHVCREELSVYLNEGHLVGEVAVQIANPKEQPTSAETLATERTVKSPPRIFISHAEEDSLARVTEALELADFAYESMNRNSGKSVSDTLAETIASMRRCTAAVIVINKTEFAGDDAQSEGCNHLMLQLGAAIMYFGPRLMLLVPKNLSLPAGLRNISFVEFEQDLDWPVAVRLARGLKQFLPTEKFQSHQIEDSRRP